MPREATSEAANKADFSQVRYAQCWEDADILLEGLDIQPGDTCLSIASAGDNSIAFLTRDPKRVVAIDLNPSQLHCLNLRIAAYQCLEYEELLELIGSRASDRRAEIYRKCRPGLQEDSSRFWDAHPEAIAKGIGAAGKFENYFRLFRSRILPLAHSKQRIAALLESKPLEERLQFYERRWNTWRWRLLFNVFFSRLVMGRLGRDPRFFDYVEGSVATRILDRVRHALTELSPADNPYLQWILLGRHQGALPTALRPEYFDTIRDRVNRLESRLASVEAFCDSEGPRSVDRFNLSDIFEYMSDENYRASLQKVTEVGRPGGRLAYWNMLAPRSRPDSMANALKPIEPLASQLHLKDKAFFYSRFVLEEIL